MVTRTIILILLSAYPAELSAQAAPTAYQPESSVGPTASSPIPTPTLKPHNPANRTEAGGKPGGPPSIVTVGGSLALVLGIFFLVVWALRRASPHRFGLLPADALEILGRAPLANRQQVHLLRCGNKLLLVSVGAAGTEPLTEITDPAEVDRLISVCRQSRPNGAASVFRQMFRRQENRDA